MNFQAIFATSTLLLVAVSQASIQSYAVRGFFKCGDQPLTDSQVILYTAHTGTVVVFEFL